MIYSSNLIGVLDACVLYPAPVRDLLLSLAANGLYMVGLVGQHRRIIQC